MLSAGILWGAQAAQAQALNCAAAGEKSSEAPARYLQISYDFSWPQARQAQLSNQFQAGCVTATYLADITDEIAREIAALGFDVRQISVLPTAEDGILSVRVTTANAQEGRPETVVLLPLLSPPSGAVITALEILGTAIEGGELIARYAVNERAYQSGGGKLRLQWTRDGKPIKGANKSRYILQRPDVGAQIGAELSYEGGDIALADSKAALVNTTILAANYPPRIEGLTIEGAAQTGEELVARYQFIDENDGDVEGDSRFIWLRDNIVIKGATGQSYRLGAKDIGAQITVRVEPQSQDGQIGQAQNATLAQTIRPRPVVADSQVVENIVIDDANKTLDVAGLEEAIEEQSQEDEVKDAPIEDVEVGKPEAKTDETIVDIAKPKMRPKPPIIAEADAPKETTEDAPEEITEDKKIADKALADKVKDAVDKPKDDVPALDKPEIDKPAIIVDKAPEIIPDAPVIDAPADDAPVLLSEPAEPPTILTEGFEIAANAPKIFTEVVFTPSAILLDYELFATQKAVQGTPITLEAIKAVLDEVNALYVAKGFELSRALLPEQLVTDGVVTIQLVEATIGQIALENRDDLSEDFILKHLGVSAGDFISLRALERSIRRYNLSNKSKLATELAPGENFGETDIFVDVAEPDKVELPSVSINNYANQTSDWRQNALSITMNNLLGTDDETALSYSDSKGSNSLSGSFSMPLDHKGTNLSLAASQSDTKIVAGSEETVGYRGSSSSFGVTLSHPLYFGDDYSLYLSGSYGSSESDLVQPVTGAMLSKSKIRKYSLSAPYSYNNGTTAVSVAPSWHILNIVTEIPKREKWMQKFDIDANASHFLSDKWTVNGRGKVLYSDARDMINMPSEILSVGGPSSVRAYQPAESSGYQGYFLSGELRTDLANWEAISLPDFMPSAQGYVFVDHMFAQSQYRQRSRADYWSGYGVGLQIPSIFNLLTFDIYWSEPLDGDVHEEEKEFYDDELFQFSLSARFRLQ